MKEHGIEDALRAIEQPDRQKSQEEGVDSLNHVAVIECEEQGTENHRREGGELSAKHQVDSAAKDKLLGSRDEDACGTK